MSHRPFATACLRCLPAPLAALLAALLLGPALQAHGGQYLPPFPTPAEQEDEEQPPLLQPGFGPLLEFSADRWEWWFDFQHEELLDVRARLRALPARADGPGFVALDDAARRRHVVPALLAGLQHHNRDVRATAAISLGRMRLPEQAGQLVAVTEDRDLFVRCNALLAVGMLGSPAGAEALDALLRDADQSSEVRLLAATGLGLLGGPEARGMLARQLDPDRLGHKDNVVRAGIVYAAGASGDAQLLPALLALQGSWLLQNDAALRAVWLVALGRLGAPGGLPPVVAGLSDSDNQIRRSAATALEALAGSLGDDQLAPVLSRAAHESDLLARISLWRALGRVRRPESRDFLQHRLDASTALLVPHVALALALDGHPSNVSLLLDILDDVHETSARSALCTSLGMLGSPAAIPALAGVLADENDPEVQGAAALGLGLIGSAPPESVALIADIATNTHLVELERLSVLALALLGEHQHLLALAQGVSKLSGTVDRAARLAALGAVADRRLLEPLLAVANDERQPSYVKTYALQALGALADPLDLSANWRLSRHVDLTHDVAFLVELYRVP